MIFKLNNIFENMNKVRIFQQNENLFEYFLTPSIDSNNNFLYTVKKYI